MAPKKTIAPYQSVFRLELNSRQDALKVTPKTFVSRKAHKKSRDGCQSCKQRRVKCDESKPRCTRCTRMDVKCHYSGSRLLAGVDSPLDLTLLTPTSKMYSMSIDLAETDLNSLLFDQDVRLDLAAVECGNVRILQHFQSVVSLTLGCSLVQNVMHYFVANTAWSYPYLMHMVLALSCAHQRRNVSDKQSRQNITLAEATNWDRGLQLYRKHLGDLERGVDAGQWDAEVATTFLQIMFTFALDDDIPLNSVNSTEDAFTHAIEPFIAIGGFRALFHTYNGFDHDSQWGRVLLSTDDHECTFTNDNPGRKGLPRALADLCDLHETSSHENNPYHRIVRALTPLFFLERSHDNFSTLFAFLGRTWLDFKPLVLSKDPRGLLLISYWLALLKQVDQWWLTTRAKSECMAIVAYLSSLHDPRINALLPFPAAFGTFDAAFMWHLLGNVIDDTV